MKKLLKPLSPEVINKLKIGLELDTSDNQNMPVIPEDFNGTLALLYQKDLINIERHHSNGKLT